MTDFDELAIMAFSGKHLPDGANTIELAAYRGLRCCYEAYKQGVISHGEASKAKAEIKAAYLLDTIMYRVYQIAEKRWKAIEWRLKTVDESDNEEIKKIIRILDGREEVDE